MGKKIKNKKTSGVQIKNVKAQSDASLPLPGGAFPVNPGGGAVFFLSLSPPFEEEDDEIAPAQPPIPEEDAFERKLAGIFLELGPRLGKSSREGAFTDVFLFVVVGLLAEELPMVNASVENDKKKQIQIEILEPMMVQMVSALPLEP